MFSLPTGTVTFLYTDIEGSTRRWESHPAEMKAAVERHDALMQEAIHLHGGVVFRTEGDAFRAAFVTAPQAFSAAIAAQRLLQAEQWNAEVAPIKVRMALHTGVGEVRGNDYVGAHLNRAARIMSAAHGGQVLLSQATFDLVRDLLPDGVSLRDLGDHRLKDLQRPEHIYQAAVPGLLSDFPPLQTLDNRPNNLPLQRSLLVGRERELDEIQDLLLRPEMGLLTLVGPGGIGKTRLALQAAAELVEHFADGVYFVPLASVTGADQFEQAISQSLGVLEAVGSSVGETLSRFLAGKQILLVLDNFEQITAAGPTVAGLLSASRGLKVIVTSREPLHLQGEQEYQVPPLALPNPRRLPPIETLSQYDAVALFIQRARLVLPNFAITNENAPAVAEICYRLDGLPLAIELAAARIRLLPPAALLERLASRLRLLTGGARDLPLRQQTLRDTIRWSYDLLNPSEQMLFRRLSVFSSGCGLEAAEAVCNASGDLEIDVLDGAASLVDKSLLRQEAGARGEPRISMLETVREFAMEILEGDPAEAEEMHSRLADYVTGLSLQAGPHLRQRTQKEWLDVLDVEHDNISSVLRWLLDRGEARKALGLIWNIWQFWYYRGYFAEVINLTERAFALPEGKQPTYERAAALMVAAIVGSRLGNFEQMGDYGRESAAIAAQVGAQARTVQAYAQMMVGAEGIYRETGVLDRPLLERSIDILREVNDEWGLALGLLDIGIIETYNGNYDEAASALEEGAALFRRLGDSWGLSQTLNSLGDVTRIREDYPRAGELYEESLALYRELNVQPDIPASLHNLGYVALALGERDKARALFAEALDLQIVMKNRGGVAECVAGLGAVAAADGEAEKAARLLEFADGVRVAEGASWWPAEKVERDRYTALARSLLAPAAWDRASADGRALTTEKAIAEALASAPAASRASA
jgi:predicted ATPase/class 3 adenylate cyclase